MSENSEIEQVHMVLEGSVQLPMRIPEVNADGAGKQVFVEDQPPQDDQEVIEDATQAIHSCMQDITQNIFEIGRQLTVLRKILEHGHFHKFIKREFGLSERYAQHFMNIYERLNIKAHIFRRLNKTALFHLAAPSVPAKAITIVEKRIREEERLSVQEVVSIIEACKRPAQIADERPETVAARLAKDLRQAVTALTDHTVENCERVLGDELAARLAEVRTELDWLLDLVRPLLRRTSPSFSEKRVVVSEPDRDTIRLGSTTRVIEVDSGREASYTIVSDEPSDPDKGRISINSPIAAALIGQKDGDIVNVDTPDGPIQLAITGVRFPDGLFDEGEGIERREETYG